MFSVRCGFTAFKNGVTFYILLFIGDVTPFIVFVHTKDVRVAVQSIATVVPCVREYLIICVIFEGAVLAIFYL